MTPELLFESEGWFTTLVQIKTSQHLLDGLPCNNMQMLDYVTLCI